MKKQKYHLAAGALAFSAISGLALPLANTFAEGASSMFDPIAEECVIRNYNNENNTNVSFIEDVDFEKITTLVCNDLGITNFHGLVLMKNLESLNVSKNANLYLEDSTLEALPKLKELDVHGNYQTRYNISKNTALEKIIGYNLILKTSAFVERVNNGEYGYKMDLSGLGFVDSDSSISATVSPDGTYSYDDSDKTIFFSKGTDILFNIIVDNGIDEYGGDNILRIETRSGSINYRIFLNGEEDYFIDSFHPDCEEVVEGDYSYYQCDDSVYYGDTLDTDSIVKNTLAKIFNLSRYKLSKVKIVPPMANIELTTNTDTVKKGTILADADFILEFYFDPIDASDSSQQESTVANSTDSTATPDTGVLTSDSPNGASVAAIIGSLIAGIATSIVAFPKIRKMIERKN